MCATTAGTSAPQPAGSWHCPKPASADRNYVLVAEDDEFVAGLIDRILARSGWRVLPAADGASCLQLLAEYRSQIALAIIDGGLPDMDGATLCRELRLAAPSLKVLLTSGRKESAVQSDVHAAFMAKPFTPGDLERHVRAVLG